MLDFIVYCRDCIVFMRHIHLNPNKPSYASWRSKGIRQVTVAETETIRVANDMALANFIKGLPGYDASKPVIIFNCDAGKGPDSPAQKLSKFLENPVRASNGETHAPIAHYTQFSDQNPSGTEIVTAAPAHVPVTGASWVTFQNGVQQSK